MGLTFASLIILPRNNVTSTRSTPSTAAEFERSWASSYFAGYDAVVWAAVMVQALGGILVALVLKYADNILKGFATSAAILMSGVVSHYLFDFVPSTIFVVGGTVVVFAILLYATPDRC